MLLAQELPAGLRRLQELDADFAEALWVLDQPRGRFNLSAMIEDTWAALSRLAPARAAFLASFDDETKAAIEERAGHRRRVRCCLRPMHTLRFLAEIRRHGDVGP
jgi:hypothetical protein